jgi:prepilin-type processing-associated H-X9-DG protein
MISLKKKQTQLIFDYAVGIADQKDKPEVERLISENPEAKILHSKFRKHFDRLDCWKIEGCPDELVESTLSIIDNSLDRTHEHYNLGKLLEKEQNNNSTVPFWRNSVETIAAAAAIIFAAAVLIAPVKYTRHLYWKTVCQSQLSSISNGLNSYRNDNENRTPSVTSLAGQPWWKVGYQGEENYSNTRNAWTLAKQGYVNPKSFVCPGARDGQELDFNGKKAEDFYDFPSRKYITYSFRIKCSKDNPNYDNSRRVLIADVNPIFSNLPENYSSSLKIELNDKLKNTNSPNHSGNGQNILFCDGSVNFKKTRHTGFSNDDIFTLRNVNVYEGNEVPVLSTDAFLAP